MRAVRLTELGGPDRLHVARVARPEPGPGQIAVRIVRAAFNRRDVYITQGLYPGIALPCTLGSDGAGTVAALGDGVDGPQPGTPVVIDPQLGWVDGGTPVSDESSILGMPVDGTFAEYCVVPAASVPHPDRADRRRGGRAPALAGLTAYRAAITRGRVSKDDVVLVTGIGGGVQTFVLLFAKHVGARVVVTSGSDEKLALRRRARRRRDDQLRDVAGLVQGRPGRDGRRPHARRRQRRRRDARPLPRDRAARGAPSSSTAARPATPRSVRTRTSGSRSTSSAPRWSVTGTSPPCSRSSKRGCGPAIDRVFGFDEGARGQRCSGCSTANSSARSSSPSINCYAVGA